MNELTQRGIGMNQSDKEKLRECCRRERENLADHLDHCDMASQTVKQRHHCYRHAAWQSGRRARRCVEDNQEGGCLPPARGR